MWYGMLKRNNASFVVGEFGWEEVVLGLISNIMVFPINIGIIFLFKKSRSKVRDLEYKTYSGNVPGYLAPRF